MAMSRHCRIILALCLMPGAGGAIEPGQSAVTGPATPAKPLIGRLFFSAAERAARRAGQPSSVAAHVETPPSESGERVEVSGTLSSSTLHEAVWLNGTHAGAEQARPDRDGRVWLHLDGHAPRLVRPGQTVDARSGMVDDLLPRGSVTRH